MHVAALLLLLAAATAAASPPPPLQQGLQPPPPPTPPPPPAIKFRLHGLYVDNMVLQRGADGTVVGFGPPGMVVRVNLTVPVPTTAVRKGRRLEAARAAPPLAPPPPPPPAPQVIARCGPAPLRRHVCLPGRLRARSCDLPKCLASPQAGSLRCPLTADVVASAGPAGPSTAPASGASSWAPCARAGRTP